MLMFLCGAAVSAAAGIGVDAPAPKFFLMNSHHQQRSLPDYKGKIVLINFWASWCAPCRAELPKLDRLAAHYSPKQMRVVAINVDRDPTPAKRLLNELGLANAHLDVLWDTRSKAVSAYNIQSMPSSVIVDARGVVRFVHAGFHIQDPEAWRQEVDTLLAKES